MCSDADRVVGGVGERQKRSPGQRVRSPPRPAPGCEGGRANSPTGTRLRPTRNGPGDRWPSVQRGALIRLKRASIRKLWGHGNGRVRSDGALLRKWRARPETHGFGDRRARFPQSADGKPRKVRAEIRECRKHLGESDKKSGVGGRGGRRGRERGSSRCRSSRL